jgi:hypothetical protein
MRLAEVPGFGVDSAPQVIAEGGTGWHVSLGGGIDLLGGNLSGEGRERRREPQQPLRQGEQISATGTEPGRPTLWSRRTAAIFRRCSGVCYRGWAIKPPSGRSPIGSVACFGRSCMSGYDFSSKAANLIRRLRSNAPGRRREHSATLSTTLQSPP